VLKEFKEFAFGGNLIDVAVALVMALALTALVASLIETIVMPIIGIIFGEPSFDNALVLTINDSDIRFGSFLTALFTFIAVAFAVFFLIVRPYQSYKARVEAGTEEPAAPPEEVVLLREIAEKVGK